MKKLLKRILVYFLAFLPFYIYACVVYPADATGYLTAPDGYTSLMIICPLIVAIVAPNLFKRYGRRKIERKFCRTSENQSLDIDSTLTAESITLIDQAAAVIFETGIASTSMLQRRLKLNYATAANIMDQLESMGVVGEFSGSTPREILISQVEYGARKHVLSNQSYATSHETTQDSIGADGFAQYGGIDATLLGVDLMEGHDFEYWCADLLQKLGFCDVEVTPGSGDHGVDILAKKECIKYAIQCKRYTADLGNTPVQEVHAGKAMYGCQVGAVITNQHFTPGGRQLAEATGVLLWDRDWIIKALERTK